MANNNEGDFQLMGAVGGAVGGVQPRRFTAEDLYYEHSLEEHVSRGLKFRLNGYHKYNMSLFDIMPMGDYEDEMFRLKEEIYIYVNEQDAELRRRPKKTEIVLAKKGKEYHRAVIMKLVWNKEYAEVYYIDSGGIAKVKVSELKAVTEDIMKYPRLGYAVFLEDMFPTSNFILWTQYDKFMETLRFQEFTVTLGSKNDFPGNFYSDRLVKICYVDWTTVVDLRDEIKQLRKWEWETYSNMTGTDAEVCEKGQFGEPYRNALRKGQVPFRYTLVPKADQFSATVSRIIPDERDPEVANLVLILLYDGLYLNYFNVLHHQLAHYAKSIKASPFFPALDEFLMFKIAEKPEYKGNVKIMGKWVRAVRASMEQLYLLDLDDFVPFTNAEIEGDCEMRPLYYEFFKIPSLSVTVRPTENNGESLSMRKAAEIFKPGKRYHFVVTKDADESKNIPYDVSFGPAEETEAKFGVANFMQNHGN